MLSLLLAGCAAQMAYREGNALVAQDRIEAGLLKYQEALAADPSNVAYKAAWLRARRRPRRETGFTYLGLLVLVTIVGLVGAAALKVDALLRRAAAEEELLEIGAAFGAAPRSYADATARGQPQQPPTLQELLKDPRVAGIGRHLRKVFVDPVAGRAEWGIVWSDPGNQSGVLAVYGLSSSTPLKQANFDARFQSLENKEHLSDWKFAATGQGIAPPPVAVQERGQDAAQGQGSLFPGRGEAVPWQPLTQAPSQPDRPGGGKDEMDKDGDGKEGDPPPAPPRDGRRQEARRIPADALTWRGA